MSSQRSFQTVVITGGATGLGYAVAQQFLDRGDYVVLNGRTQSKLQEAARKLGQHARFLGDRRDTAG